MTDMKEGKEGKKSKWVLSKRQYREITAITASVVLIGLGFFAAWFSKEVLKIESDVTYITVLLLPIIAYVILSGRLKELRVGGLEAKFADAAEQQIEIDSETVGHSAQDLQILEKGFFSPFELQERLKKLDETKPIVFTLILEHQGLQFLYNRDSTLKYVEVLSQKPNYKFVVIQKYENNEKKFWAYIPSRVFLQILRVDDLGNRLIDCINRGDTEGLSWFPGVVTRTLSTKASNLDALQEMTNKNMDALVITDESKRLAGVVEREQILSKLLLAMSQ
jgi:hypothetical protein